MHLIVKRILALIIDWMIIVLYAVALFTIMAALASAGVITLGTVHPVTGQLIGFFTLTLPVILSPFFSKQATGMQPWENV